MSLKYTDNSDIFISRDENITDVTLNRSLTKLIENDFSISPTQNIEPKIWECKWFSDENVKGYDKGYAVWLNTEDEDEFLKNKSDNVYDYIKKHPYFTDAKEYNNKDADSRSLYHSLLTGYVDADKNRKLQPVFFLGNLSAQVQIKISTKDNNKDTPDTLSSWRDYFIRDYSEIESAMSSYGDELFDQHVEELHFGDAEIDVAHYADANLVNVEPIEQYSRNTVGTSLTGFDYITSQSHVNDTVSIDFEQEQTEYRYGYKLSSYTYVLDSRQVHRDINDLESKMKGTHNYENDGIELAFEQLEKDSNLYFTDIEFVRLSTYANFDAFPLVVTYDKWDTISSIIGQYNVTYSMKTLVDTTVSSYDIAPTYYMQKNPGLYYSEWTTSVVPPDPSEDYALDESLTETNVVYVSNTECHKIRRGYDLWKSGYLEQFGYVACPPNSNTTVTLPNSYEYEVEDASFYDLYTSIGDYRYDETDNIGKYERYTVQLTQIYFNGFDDSDIEINTIKNNCFSIYNGSNNKKYYLYTTRGYVSRSSL